MTADRGLAASLVAALTGGDRRALSKAITLVESELAQDRRVAFEMLRLLPPVAPERSLRLAVTGAPGVGKSTLVDALGGRYLQAGHRVFVVTVDPSSAVSGGSILGDKTRMARLIAAREAFVRPSPSKGASGGVAERTREVIQLAEAAGYDRIFVETVGVGQGEDRVRGMVDLCLVLLNPASGDELTAIKRGLLEVGDVFAVNKADGDNAQASAVAVEMYKSALSVLLGRPVPVLGVSAVEETNLDELKRWVETEFAAKIANGVLPSERAEQRRRWFEELIESGLVCWFHEQAEVRRQTALLGQRVAEGLVDPMIAADEVLALVRPPAT